MGSIVFYSKVQDPKTWDTGDDTVVIGPGETFTTEWTYGNDLTSFKEDTMNISSDYTGKIKRIGKQFLLQLGCMEFICQNLNAVGAKVTEVLTAEYKKRDAPEEDQ